MKTIILIGCSASKQSAACRAREMYTGQLFKLQREYAEMTGHQWFILSANYEHYGLVEPFLIRYNGGNRVQSIDNPLTTLDTSNRFGLVEPFLINYNGNGDAQSVDTPLDTVTTRDRFGLVSPELIEGLSEGDQVYLLDIHFRMLQPHELAAAHSFPKDYEFTGGREDRVKQVGNSWPCNLATALCEEILR